VGFGVVTYLVDIKRWKILVFQKDRLQGWWQHCSTCLDCFLWLLPSWINIAPGIYLLHMLFDIRAKPFVNEWEQYCGRYAWEVHAGVALCSTTPIYIIAEGAVPHSNWSSNWGKLALCHHLASQALHNNIASDSNPWANLVLLLMPCAKNQTGIE
jgi:hypothetical protein